MTIKSGAEQPEQSPCSPFLKCEEKSNGKQLVTGHTGVLRHPGATVSRVAAVYGVVGMLVGVIIAAQLAWPELNLGIPFLSYGRCGRCTPTR
jgi:hypothetical protein